MSKKLEVCIRILMKAINYAANEIAKFDDEYKKKLQGIESIIIWKMGRNLTFYTEIWDGKIMSGEGEKENASLAIEIDDIKRALKMLTGQVDFADMIKIAKISGDSQKIQQNVFILEAVKEYLGDIIGER